MIKTIKLGPISGLDRFEIDKMVGLQISQRFDEPRMRCFWERLFAGDNDPKELAAGLCLALSNGRYVRKRDAGVMNINVQVFGEASPEDIAKAVSGAMTGAATQSA